MRLGVVTSVYHLRKTRPLGYYLQPAIDFLDGMAGSDVQVYLYSDLEKSLFPKASNIHHIDVPPTDFISEMWPSPTWRKDYMAALADRPLDRFEEKEIPELIAIWLGKMEMMNRIAGEVDAILWQDSGIRMGRVFRRDFNNYKKCRILPERYIASVESVLKDHPISFMESLGYVNPYHGIDMRKYSATRKDHARAGFILLKSNEAEALKINVKNYWRLLIENGDFGTEENPLTLYYWDRPDSGLFSYDMWLFMFGLDSRKQLFL